MDVFRILCESDGFFTRAQARDLGCDDRAVAEAVRVGLWHRIRRGYFHLNDLWSALDEVGQHRVRSKAVLHSLGEGVALSHVSGVVAHRIDTWGIDLSHVHVTRLDKHAGRLEGDVIHHEGRCLKSDVIEVDGCRVLVADRCVLEAGSRAGGERALVMLNSGLYLGKFSQPALSERFEAMGSWPFMRSMHIPIRLSDPGCQSVGESRGLHFMWAHHLPAPMLQYPVYDHDGVLIGTVDWAWPERRQYGEFDGKLKYGRILRPGQDVGEVVFAEKQREDAIREATDGGMIRVVWTDYDRPRVLEARLRRKLGLRAG